MMLDTLLMFGELFNTLSGVYTPDEPKAYARENQLQFENRMKRIEDAREYEKMKNLADRTAEAEYLMSIEKDPLKRLKMEKRLEVGVTDFSDL